jgi:GNAT superfamily N-acetyltransferase
VTLEIRLLTGDDDLAPELALTRRAFGPGDDERRLASMRPGVASGRYLAAFDGAAMVASARYLDMRQWWRGRSLPAAGVSSVKVAPELRGRGVGRALMTGLLEQVAHRGYPLAVLYPLSIGVYRSLGWEFGGDRYSATMPAGLMREMQPPDPQAVSAGGEAGGGLGAGTGAAHGNEAGAADARPELRRAGPADTAALTQEEGDLFAAGRDCGPASYDPATLARLIDNPDIFTYAADDGQLVYQWGHSGDELVVWRLLAGSAATNREMWSIVASHATMASTVRAFVGPAGPLGWLAREPGVTLTRRDGWMLRLVDAQAAVAGRGFPPGAEVTVWLAVQDREMPANSGRWLLHVGDGNGGLFRSGTGSGVPLPATPPLCLGARGLAALYSGTPMLTLRQAGLVTGGDRAADAALDEAFGCTPYMLNYF